MLFASAGYQVNLYDLKAEQVISFHLNLGKHYLTTDFLLCEATIDDRQRIILNAYLD